MIRLSSFVLVLLTFFTACKKLPVDPAFAGFAVNVPGDSVSFAVIGDYGNAGNDEQQVADMVKSWNPEFIITLGDNNYPVGSAGTIVSNIGDYYCDYIYNPDAPPTQRCHGKAAEEEINRFFPSPGNHDNASAPALQPYLDYFTLPGDERNYEFTWGPVHFFSINTGLTGNLSCCGSVESNWLQLRAIESQLPFKMVYFHHPPYSVSQHGSSTNMRWPFADWGIDAVLNGHDHVYERIQVKAQPTPIYFVSGNGGNENGYNCTDHPLDSAAYSVYCDNAHIGAMKVNVTQHTAVFEYYGVGDPNHPLDTYIIHK